LAWRLLAARADDAAHPAGERRQALGVVGARRVTCAAVALVGAAARGGRHGAHASRAAGRRLGVAASRAALGRADRSRRVLSAGARAVALAVGRAHRGRQILADGAGIGAARRDQGAGSQRASDRAAATGPRAGRGATDPVDTVPVDALGGDRTGLSVDLLAAGPDRLSRRDGAGVPGSAIGRGGAGLVAGAALAGEVSTLEALRGETGSETVAGSSRVPRGRVHAGRQAARAVGGVRAAASLAVADPGRSAGRRILLEAKRVSLAGGSRRAGAHEADLIAGLASASASAVAAESVGAMARAALRVGAAGHAARLGPAATAQAMLAGDAVGIGGAGAQTLIGRCAAEVRRADGDRARLAVARAVADVGAGDLRAVAGPLGADSAKRIEPAGPFAVAGPVLTAAGLLVGAALTGVVRLDARRDHRAGAQRGRQRARHTRPRARAVATEPVDAELALALTRAAARQSVVLGRTARAARSFRTIDRAVGLGVPPTVGPSRDPVGTTVRLADQMPRRARATHHQHHEKRDCSPRVTPPPNVFH
jgi:hypothetical protein